MLCCCSDAVDLSMPAWVDVLSQQFSSDLKAFALYLLSPRGIKGYPKVGRTGRRVHREKSAVQCISPGLRLLFVSFCFIFFSLSLFCYVFVLFFNYVSLLFALFRKSSLVSAAIRAVCDNLRRAVRSHTATGRRSRLSPPPQRPPALSSQARGTSQKSTTLFAIPFISLLQRNVQ